MSLSVSALILSHIYITLKLCFANVVCLLPEAGRDLSVKVMVVSSNLKATEKRFYVPEKKKRIKLLFYMHIFQDSWVQFFPANSQENVHFWIEVGKKKKKKNALSIETEDHKVFQYKHLHKLTLKVPHLSVSVIPCCFVQYFLDFTATPFVFSRKQCLYRDDWFVSRAL